MAEVPTDLLMMHASFWPESDAGLGGAGPGSRLVPAAQRLIEHPRRTRRSRCCAGTARSSSAQTLQEALMRAILAEEHAQQLVTALSHGRALAPRADDRGSGRVCTSRVLSARTHDMHWDYAGTFVELAPGARGSG